MITLRMTLLATALSAGADQPGADATTYALREAVSVGDQTHYRAHVVLRGRIRTTAGEQSVAGQVLLQFADRVTEIGAEGQPTGIVRHYDDARAKFVVANSQEARQLRPAVRLLVGRRHQEAMKLWSPGGPMTSDERELIEDFIDVTRLPGLLPSDPVAVGQSWNPDPGVQQALCDLEGFIDSTVACSLKKIEGNKAVIGVAGVVHGLALGAEVKSKLDSTIVFDTKTNRIETVEWKQTDGRAGGPVSPAGAYDVTVDITRKPTESRFLTDEVLKTVSLEPKTGSELLAFEHPDGKFRFHHDRDWHLTLLRPELAVLRRLDDSQLTAQLNIQLLADRKRGTVMSAEAFQHLIEQADGFEIDQILRSDNLPTDGTFQLRLLVAGGKRDGVALVQRHYLVTTEAGRQMIFSFVVEPQLQDALGTHDLSLVGSVEFPADQAAANADKSAK